MAELPEERDAGRSRGWVWPEVPEGWDGDGPDRAEAWAQGLWLACLAAWGMAPLWMPLPVRWACMRRRDQGRDQGRGRRDG
ncbi:hypothetical protein E1287_43065 [Actinomadura sp. KC06]|uniref:hypothetical protein n=1 Tax=Actinomadura sp. KC06 TaxID=2530369 RepID=UPI00104C91F1|nr:hypothetical protein [Actinomadura sp. KC06]TDD13897.1 hypothetical protein E1287_43065 [Actinomadura sp. KC06]